MNDKSSAEIERRIHKFSRELISEGVEPSLVCHCLVAVGMICIQNIIPTHVRFDLLRTTCKRALKALDHAEMEICNKETKH